VSIVSIVCHPHAGVPCVRFWSAGSLLLVTIVMIVLVAGGHPAAGALRDGEPGQQGRPRRGAKECAHDIESAHARHRAEARRCARQKHRAQCEAANDRRLQSDLARINAVCGDYISTQGEPDRDADRPPPGRPRDDGFATEDPPPVRRLPPPADPGGGRPRVRPEPPSSDDGGLLPPGFPFPPAEARPPRTTPHPRERADTRPVIVALGDSITAGFQLKPEEAYPAVLQRRLDAAGYRYHVMNAGVTGDTTTAAYRRLDQALVPNTRILIVALGLNDYNRNRPGGEIETNLIAIIARARQRGIAVLLCGFDALPAFDRRYENRFIAMYPAVAARTGVPLLRDLLARVWPYQEMVQRDTIHPSAAGARVIAEDVFTALRPMIETASSPRPSRSPTR
jgi:acyl-CoA thioesterase-1